MTHKREIEEKIAEFFGGEQEEERKEENIQKKIFIGEGDARVSRPKQQQHQVGSHRHQNNPQYS